ncbi:MAG TPA: polysaccharide biosynthesis/export family protein [candidate division Zixibacteria bacterium]|nr:polysaccharide biosynthesis/export family protein [candidate division Zixibacteria bacterium]
MIRVVLLSLLLAGVVAAQAPGTSPALKIGSGDLLDVAIYDNPDLSGRFRVDEKGAITLPLVGSVTVEGLTAEQAAAKLQERYKSEDILKSPQATVFISEYATQGITVNGEVKSPGLYPALGVRMLNDVIAAAGGETPTAADNVIITRKSDPAHPITVEYRPTALTPEKQNLQIMPGDTIMVPRAGIVYVLGAVQRPGGFALEGRETLTVMEAMALAQGTAHGASLKHTRLVRTDAQGRHETLVAVNEIFKGRAPDVTLKDGDILYVPTSNGKIAASRTLDAVIGLGSGVALYRASNR